METVVSRNLSNVILLQSHVTLLRSSPVDTWVNLAILSELPEVGSVSGAVVECLGVLWIVLRLSCRIFSRHVFPFPSRERAVG